MYGWLWRVPMAMLLRNEVSLTPQPGSRGTNLLCEAPGKLPSTLGGTGRAAWGPGVAVPGVRWVLGAAQEVLSFLRVTAGIWCLGSGSCPDAPNWGCRAGRRCRAHGWGRWPQCRAGNISGGTHGSAAPTLGTRLFPARAVSCPQNLLSERFGVGLGIKQPQKTAPGSARLCPGDAESWHHRHQSPLGVELSFSPRRMGLGL